MWPWEHLAVGYLLYSLYARLRRGGSPGGGEVVALGVGTQFPDLVDKPIAWLTGLLPSGSSLAHSVFVAVPASVVAIGVARRYDRSKLGVAFAVGYLSHLPGDAVYPVFLGGSVGVGRLLWPVVPTNGHRSTAVVPLVEHFFDRFVRRVTSPAGIGYVAVELGLLGSALLAWLRDGTPGLRATRRWLTDGR